MNAQEQRLEVAADWLLRLRDPAILPGEIADWHAWCEAEPENRQAFLRMQSLWRHSGDLQERPVECAALENDKYAAQVPVREWRATHPEAPARTGRRSAFLGAGLAASVALAAGGVWFVHGQWQRGSVQQISIIADEGVNRDVTLPDGSSVTAVAGSALSTRFNGDERHVFLQLGKAFFRVEHDANRPFVVHALDTKVTAIGTAFAVSAAAGVVEVAVTEGSVDVGRPQPVPLATSGGHGVAGVANVRVEAGYQITLKEDEPAPAFASINAMDIEASVTGTLQFADEPLASVVDIVNRHASMRIMLAGDLPRGLRYTGTVVIARIDEWLEGLPDIYPVYIRRTPGGGSVAITPAVR
jgi:transmembrane sensor